MDERLGGPEIRLTSRRTLHKVAWLGFFLPGLGHLYLGRPFRAAALALAAGCLLWMALAPWLFPILALWAACEGVWLGRRSPARPTTAARDAVFGVVAALSALLWVPTLFLPHGSL